MPGDTLSVYFGEMLISPIPLELSFNYCSHGCRFCFANLNKPERTADIKATMRMLRDYMERESFEAQLLREGYPVVVSNRVDPFAHSNYQQAVPVLRVMTELGIPVAIQTRGGRGINEALEFLKPSVWYVSISTLDEDLRKRLEPGAPTIESRFALMEQLVSRGHRVVLGCNPAVPEWLPDPAALFGRAKSAGAEGSWVEILHFNYKQVANMSDRDREYISADLIARSQKRNADEKDWEHFERARNEACEAGLAVFSMGQPNASEFFRPYRETYPKTFPVIQDFVNHAWEKRYDEMFFEDFAEAMTGLPEGKRGYGHVFGASAHQLFRERKLSNMLTPEQFLKVCWNEPQAKQCPARVPCFAFTGIEDGVEADVNGMAILQWRPQGFREIKHYKEN